MTAIAKRLHPLQDDSNGTWAQPLPQEISTKNIEEPDGCGYNFSLGWRIQHLGWIRCLITKVTIQSPIKHIPFDLLNISLYICRATTRPPRPSSTAECLRLIARLRGEQASAASWEPRPPFEATEMD